MTSKTALDSLLEEFSVTETDRKPEKCLAYWVDEKVHQSYRDLQDKTGKEFGKWIENLLVTIIRKKHEATFGKSA